MDGSALDTGLKALADQSGAIAALGLVAYVFVKHCLPRFDTYMQHRMRNDTNLVERLTMLCDRIGENTAWIQYVVQRLNGLPKTPEGDLSVQWEATPHDTHR